MLRFVLRRLALMVPVLVGLSILLFMWIRWLPGDPARALLGERATPEGIARVNEAYGFNEPLLQQYFTYVRSLLSGDFGNSIKTGQPVVSSFFEKFPATFELALAALLFAVVVGVPLGYLAARNQGRSLDTIVVSTSLLGVVTPVFFLAILLKLVFATWLHWLPTSLRQDPRMDATHVTNLYVLDGFLTGEWDAAWDAMIHLVLPALALGTIPLAIIVRITRASVAEVLNEDYVRTATAKGLSPWTVSRRHILRNALLPVVTTIGLQAGLLFSGAVLTETVFSFNGVGQYLYESISGLDYPVLQGYILFIALIYSVINLVVDVSYGVIDPRVRVSRARSCRPLTP
jgi:peptide/nickel transport system permease protein